MLAPYQCVVGELARVAGRECSGPSRLPVKSVPKNSLGIGTIPERSVRSYRRHRRHPSDTTKPSAGEEHAVREVVAHVLRRTRPPLPPPALTCDAATARVARARDVRGLPNRHAIRRHRLEEECSRCREHVGIRSTSVDFDLVVRQLRLRRESRRPAPQPRPQAPQSRGTALTNFERFS